MQSRPHTEPSTHRRRRSGQELGGRPVVITRPVGTADTLVRLVRAAGGVPLLLPGLALRATGPEQSVREQVRQALADELVLFTSPAAVRFAAQLVPLQTSAQVLAVGTGTARALQRHGLDAQVPAVRQDSEGLLGMPLLQQVQGRAVAVVGAAGGRGLLPAQLRLRGARLREVHVYARQPAQLDRRHLDPLRNLRGDACVLWSSGDALENLHLQLPDTIWERLCAAEVVVSSERLATLARHAGFGEAGSGPIRVAASARPHDLLAALVAP